MLRKAAIILALYLAVVAFSPGPIVRNILNNARSDAMAAAQRDMVIDREIARFNTNFLPAESDGITIVEVRLSTEGDVVFDIIASDQDVDEPRVPSSACDLLGTDNLFDTARDQGRRVHWMLKGSERSVLVSTDNFSSCP